MASGHLRVNMISRSAGSTSTAAAAYRAACRIVSEDTGEIHDYRRKTGVMSSELIFPVGEKKLASDELWNMADDKDYRKNSCVARELVIGLSHEMPEADRRELALELAQEIADEHKCAIEVSIHEPRRLSKSEIDALDDPLSHATFDAYGHPTNGNFHAHILMTTRKFVDGELTAKTREWDDLKTRVILKDKWQDRWVDKQNDRFQELGMDVVVVIERGTGEKHKGVALAKKERDEADKRLDGRSLNLDYFNARMEMKKAERDAKLSTAERDAALEKYETSRLFIESPEEALADLKRERALRGFEMAERSEAPQQKGLIDMRSPREILEERLAQAAKSSPDQAALGREQAAPQNDKDPLVIKAQDAEIIRLDNGRYERSAEDDDKRRELAARLDKITYERKQDENKAYEAKQALEQKIKDEIVYPDAVEPVQEYIEFYVDYQTAPDKDEVRLNELEGEARESLAATGLDEKEQTEWLLLLESEQNPQRSDEHIAHDEAKREQLEREERAKAYLMALAREDDGLGLY